MNFDAAFALLLKHEGLYSNHAAIGSVIAVCIVILRAITTQPLSEK